MENSTHYTESSKCSKTILLKADMGADVNLMNICTFYSLFPDRSVLQPTPTRMENYGNTGIKGLGKFHMFLRWKDQVFKQLFYVTNADNSPNLLSRDACYTLGVLKPCYSVERELSSSSTASTQPQVTPIHTSEVGKSFPHYKNEGSMEKVTNYSTKCSISKEQLQGTPLTKQKILDVYSDVFTGIWKFPGEPYKFQLKENAKPARNAPRKVPIHLQEAFHEEIRDLEQSGILEETKDCTEWVNCFVIVGKKVPLDSSNTHSPGRTVKKKLRTCLDPRDLNEALEREPYYTCSIIKIIGKFHGRNQEFGTIRNS